MILGRGGKDHGDIIRDDGIEDGGLAKEGEEMVGLVFNFLMNECVADFNDPFEAL